MATAAAAASLQNFTSLGYVMVVGGCGFLGYHIVKLILEQYPESIVSAVDVHLVNQVEDSRVFYHVCDITNAKAVSGLLEKLKPGVVIHTAGVMPSPSTSDSFIEKVNYRGTVNLVEASKKAGVKAFVYTSSSSVTIGNVEAVINTDETWPLLTGSEQPEYYSRMKALGEEAVLEANRSIPNFLTASIRPAGMLGEHDTQLSKRPLLISSFGTKFQIGDNNNLFDATYVGNIAHAHLLAVKALLIAGKMSIQPLDCERVDGEAFIITNGSPVYFWDLMRSMWFARDGKYDMKQVWVLPVTLALILATVAEVVFGLFGKVPNFTRQAIWNASRPRYFCIDKARERLKYEPIWTLEEGIKRGVAANLADIKREREVIANKIKTG